MIINKKLSIAVDIVTIVACNKAVVISNKNIAEKLGVSGSYVEQFALPMRKAGIIKSKHGPGGGYYFDSVPSKVSVAMIADAIFGKQERSNLDLVTYNYLKSIHILGMAATL